ncbi:DUF305 domain-containing protein [Weissella paramesenteroides]|uniref:DUF305 domain-containing protein n=1 Tax=Weissella paramesenteroides TaxID=1249 RepID=UPI00223B2684|nr:DUF305 domain-containing protein [Weissella paramesenteroides]MCS9984471.1 DUF305 domain-containing protein [Weissella paramesenteroides]MCS9998227.1 DUF305 domain-containing protein [Weissella paramesenteroides]MCT0259770.1 DUF305 domain-containing protein [Weissella paramesenteroides]
MGKYRKFLLMIFVSTVIMYGMMFLNVFSFTHIHISVTRILMALMMGAAMAIIMLLFMWQMYPSKKKNGLILVISAVIFVASLFMVRTQTGVSDISWMKAMIPHHSIAILTSTEADLKDPEVKKLAHKIIKTQKKEIKEMNQMIERLQEKD